MGTEGREDEALLQAGLEALKKLYQEFGTAFTCCVPDAREGGVVLGVGAMEAGDIRSSDAMQQAWQMGKNV